MKEMTMLALDKVDLAMLCEALEDNSPEAQWWLDPATGEVVCRFPEALSGEPEEGLGERGFLAVAPVGSGEAYGDLQDFTNHVKDARARDLLERAIAGRGAFRRFKDTLFEFPELREAWFSFRDARLERRALEWLAEHDVVPAHDIERALLERRDPELPDIGSEVDGRAIAQAAARDLSALYGTRLKEVVLFGSWARGDAHPDSDIDLAVVLDAVRSPGEERDAMDDLLWRHSLAHDTVVTAFAVAQSEWTRPSRPVLITAKTEGIVVG